MRIFSGRIPVFLYFCAQFAGLSYSPIYNSRSVGILHPKLFLAGSRGVPPMAIAWQMVRHRWLAVPMGSFEKPGAVHYFLPGNPRHQPLLPRLSPRPGLAGRILPLPVPFLCLVPQDKKGIAGTRYPGVFGDFILYPACRAGIEAAVILFPMFYC